MITNPVFGRVSKMHLEDSSNNIAADLSAAYVGTDLVFSTMKIYYAKASSGTAITSLSQMTPITVSSKTRVDIPISSVNSEFIFIAYPSTNTVTIFDQGGLEEGWTTRTISDVGYTLRRSGKITDSSAYPLYHLSIQ